MKDINKYFNDYRLYLESVEYSQNDVEVDGCKIELHCEDSLTSEILNGRALRLTLERKLAFKPIKIIDLSVRFCALIDLENSIKDEIDWESVDIEKELLESNTEILGNLISRTSMLIAQLTSSNGNNPIITPPSFFAKK